MSVFTFSVRHRDLVWAVALVVLLSTIWVARSDLADAGGSPPGEGIAVVYVSVGTNFPDSLGIGPGAGANGAPIIILPTNPPIPGPSADELVRLDPRTVIIVGGLGVISQATENDIEALLPNTTVTRIAGSNRYETNAMFSAATFPIETWAAIPAAAFSPHHPATDNSFVAGEVWNTDGALSAPIQLPHGAEILEMTVGAIDTDPGAPMFVVFGRYSAAGDDDIAFAQTAGDSGQMVISTTAITDGTEIVDNQTYAYVISASGADGDPTLINVMVRYRLGAAGG